MIEELKRIMDEAKAKKTLADFEYNEAAKRYSSAKNAGYVGKLAANNRFTIIIQDVHFAHDKPLYFTGKKLTRQGMPTNWSGTVYAPRAKISDFIKHDTGELV